MENIEQQSFNESDEREKWLAVWNGKTNTELVASKIFIDWLKNSKGVEIPTKRQASKHRDEFLQLLTTEFGDEVRERESQEQGRKNLEEMIKEHPTEFR